MFDQSTKNRTKLALIWITSLIVLIGILYLSIQPFRHQALDKVDDLKQNVLVEDWESAKQRQNEIESLWKRNKFLIQINNLTPAISRFEQDLVSVKLLLDNEDDDALEYIGLLKETLKSITSIIPTPEG